MESGSEEGGDRIHPHVSSQLSPNIRGGISKRVREGDVGLLTFHTEPELPVARNHVGLI